METINGIITEENILRLLVQRHVKPLIKEALAEFFAENSKVLISRSEPQAQLLKTADVAKLLGVNRGYLYQLVRNGFPCMQIGKSRRFRIEDVQKYVAERIQGKPQRVNQK